MHPVVHVHIMNTRGLLMLQKRSSTKDIQPGKWDTSVGGHISSGEKLEQAVIREVKEEAGIDIDINKAGPIAKYVFESDIEKELVFSFIYITDQEIVFDRKEIDEISFFNFTDINELVEKNLTTGNFKKELLILTEVLKINKNIRNMK